MRVSSGSRTTVGTQMPTRRDQVFVLRVEIYRKHENQFPLKGSCVKKLLGNTIQILHGGILIKIM